MKENFVLSEYILIAFLILLLAIGFGVMTGW